MRARLRLRRNRLTHRKCCAPTIWLEMFEIQSTWVPTTPTDALSEDPHRSPGCRRAPCGGDNGSRRPGPHPARQDAPTPQPAAEEARAPGVPAQPQPFVLRMEAFQADGQARLHVPHPGSLFVRPRVRPVPVGRERRPGDMATAGRQHVDAERRSPRQRPQPWLPPRRRRGGESPRLGLGDRDLLRVTPVRLRRRATEADATPP
jgi:hypothetical protein